MSFHLEGPWLSTSGKKKGKQKFASAEHARKARDLDQSWKELQKRWGIEADEKKRQRAMTAEPLSGHYSLTVPPGRNTTAHIRSVDTGLGNTALKPVQHYTGDKVLGISQMAKSNAVPVFNSDHIVEIARMRR